MDTWPELIQSIQGERTQRQLAADLGVTEGAVCHWIKGKRVPGGRCRRALYGMTKTTVQREAMTRLLLRG
jgi:predicted transcriptional regulator